MKNENWKLKREKMKLRKNEDFDFIEKKQNELEIFKRKKVLMV